MKNKLYLVRPSRSESGTLETLPETNGMELIIDTDVLVNNFKFSINDKVCITSESSLEIVKEKLIDLSKKRAIDLLKDKYKFREILSDIYPSYQFKKIKFDDITSLEINKKTVLKPLKGCFGTAVKIIDQNSNLKMVSQEIKKELDKNSSVLSDGVLSYDDFILEDYISGEEYAVDMFYDDKGEPNIVNIYHHPMPKIDSYLHMIYYTSKDVFDKIYEPAIDFFRNLNKILKVKNFVLHSEFKFEDILFPIEMNAMRYGGMGLGNMMYHTIGLDPYECFDKGKGPNWNSIWKKYNSDNFVYFIAYNGTNVNFLTQEPDIEKLKNEFTVIQCEKLFDYKSQLTFGIFCIKEDFNNIQRLLTIDFNEYFKDIKK